MACLDRARVLLALLAAAVSLFFVPPSSYALFFFHLGPSVPRSGEVASAEPGLSYRIACMLYSAVMTAQA